MTWTSEVGCPRCEDSILVRGEIETGLPATRLSPREPGGPEWTNIAYYCCTLTVEEIEWVGRQAEQRILERENR